MDKNRLSTFQEQMRRIRAKTSAAHKGWPLFVSCTLIVLTLCLLEPTIYEAAAPAAVVPTPTPTVSVPLRNYDPPAPPDLTLSPAMQELKIADIDGFPHIVKLWGGYEADVGLEFYAQYDLFISQAFTDAQLLALRTLNPNMIILYSGTGTYDLDDGPLGNRWINAEEGTPEFECFYRGTNNQVLKVSFWNHGMFNMGNDWCVDEIVDYLVVGRGSVSVRQFDPGIHDGVFFDRVNQAITPNILQGIDRDHDGIVDNRDQVNEEYWKGTERFLDKVRQRLGDEVIIVANDAPLVYASRLNGREYETFIRGILDGDTSWTWFQYNYEQWMQASREPRLTMVMTNPPRWMESKYGLPPWITMKKAVVDEAASYYRRMRFGLTSALMEGGLYSFEFGTTWHGNAWWYDEYDGAGLGKGYLGSPVGKTYYATGSLATPNLVQNPGFEDPGSTPWTLYVHDAQATWQSVPITASHNTAAAARIVITAGNQLDAVRLEQANISLVGDRAYTLSFWGKATAQLWDTQITLHASGDIDAVYGLDERLEMGTAWQEYWVPFTATATVDNAVLSFASGLYTGTVWIDEVSLQEGTLPTVFRRDFEHGIAICNATRDRQTVPLDSTYRKITSAQAPMTKIIIDDTEELSTTFTLIGGWGRHRTSDDYYYDCWGDTYHHALGTSYAGTTTQAIWRPNIPYTDWYTVFTWLVPHPKYTDTVTYTIQHADGTTSVSVSPPVSEPTWANLGTYFFEASTETSVALSNHSDSTWVVADAVKFESVTRYNDGSEVTAITLEEQDGIVLLGPPSGRADLVRTTSNPQPVVGETLTFTLRFRRTDVAAQALRVRVADPNPAPSYLKILVPTITGGALYSPTIGGVVWEGELDAGSPPVRVTFRAEVTGTIPGFSHPITHTATMIDLSKPGSAPLQIASTLIRIRKEFKNKLLMPLVLQDYATTATDTTEPAKLGSK